MKIGKTHKFYVDVYSRHSGVTGSCFLNSIHWPDGSNLRFLVDAGAAQGNDNDGFFNCFFPFNTGKIDFVILTHGHHDHQGLLPVIVRQGFRGNIYTSYATSRLINLSLYDSCVISDPSLGTPLASQNEVERTLDLIVGCPIKKVIKPHKNVNIVFYSNGHLLGAIVTLVIISCPGEDDITLVYTGDYKDNNIFFDVDKISQQTRELKISSIFCESTYGDVDSTDNQFSKCLAKNTANALKEGMTVVYPTFAQGRCQEALYSIKLWKNTNIIPKDTPIVLDGKASQRFTKSYMYDDLGIKPSMKRFMPENIKFVPQTRDRMMYREDVMSDTTPKIILSSGGMASYGPIQNYISNYLPRNDALIHLLGYCSPDSEAFNLLNTADGDKILYKGSEFVKRCQVAKTSELSSHAKRDELLKFIKDFPNVKSVVINHGEISVKKLFREYLLENLNIPEEQIAISDPEIAFRIESDGISDVFKTNFSSIL